MATHAATLLASLAATSKAQYADTIIECGVGIHDDT